MEIINKTKRRLRIPLPQGKTLHLGPGRTGQISAKAADHPPLVKLIEGGDVEILDRGHSQGTGGSGGSTGLSPGQDRASDGGVRHTGDR